MTKFNNLFHDATADLSSASIRAAHGVLHARRPTSRNVLAMSAVAVAVLSGCGGGGNGDLQSTVDVGLNQVAIQTTVPEPGYPVGSAYRVAFDYLNRQRLNCGFGALRHSSVLDKPAINHVRYILANWSNPALHPHTEVSTWPGFTGVTPTDRARAVGYKTNAAEVGEMGAGFWNDVSPDQLASYSTETMPLQAVRSLLVVPYHAMHMIAPYTEMGFGMEAKQTYVPAGSRPNPLSGSNPASWDIYVSTYLTLGYAMDGQGQLPPAGTGVRTYPCEGTTDVPPAVWGEWTDPTLGPGLTPGRNLAQQPTGTTIMVMGEVNKTLALTGATVVQERTGIAVPIYQLRTKATDPMGKAYYRNDWTGYVMPDQPLLPNERYRVTVQGTSGGTSFSRSFSFTTGVSSVAP